jgi:hypothetical protein
MVEASRHFSRRMQADVIGTIELGMVAQGAQRRTPGPMPRSAPPRLNGLFVTRILDAIPAYRIPKEDWLRAERWTGTPESAETRDVHDVKIDGPSSRPTRIVSTRRFEMFDHVKGTGASTTTEEGERRLPLGVREFTSLKTRTDYDRESATGRRETVLESTRHLGIGPLRIARPVKTR